MVRLKERVYKDCITFFIFLINPRVNERLPNCRARFTAHGTNNYLSRIHRKNVSPLIFHRIEFINIQIEFRNKETVAGNSALIRRQQYNTNKKFVPQHCTLKA